MNKAITIISGGLDSMVSTAIARERHEIILGLTFDYGQRAAIREIEASQKMCRLWGIPHKVITLPWLKELTGSALMDRNKKLPALTSQRSTIDEQRTAKAVWVPNRNALFINIAACFAEEMGAGIIVTGFNKEEAATFPDNSAEFVSAVNEALSRGTLKNPQVVSYTQNMDKRSIASFAKQNDLPLSDCWPCYEGGEKLCLKCESCVRFASAVASV